MDTRAFPLPFALKYMVNLITFQACARQSCKKHANERHAKEVIEKMYIKSNGEIVHQVNARISDRAYQIARKQNLSFSKVLDSALIQGQGEKHGTRD
jgi:hypothetical protein